MSWGNSTIGFNVVAKDTPENKAVIQSFTDFCAKECQGNYTVGLSILLSCWEDRTSLIFIYQKIAEFEERLQAFESKKTKSVETTF